MRTARIRIASVWRSVSKLRFVIFKKSEIMDKNNFCVIFNVSYNSKNDDFDNDNIANIVLITIPFGLSLIAQIALLTAAFNASNRDRHRISIFHDVFLSSFWIFIACLAEVNRRFEFLLIPHEQTWSKFVCKTLAFCQLTTQALAVCGLLVMAISVRR